MVRLSERGCVGRSAFVQLTYCALLSGLCGLKWAHCNPIELEYFQTVKQTFGLPGNLRSQDQHETTGLKRQFELVVDGGGKGSEEEVLRNLESMVTVFSYTIFVVSVIGVIVVLLVAYCLFSLISFIIHCVNRRRDKQSRLHIFRPSNASSTDDTETSSLDSVSSH